MVRKTLLIILGILCFSTFISFLTDYSINLLGWVNSLFYCSLLLTIVGGAMLVIQGGFFNGMIRSSKRFFQKSNPVVRVLQDSEGTKEDIRPYSVSFTLTSPFLLAGSILLVFSILFSLVISF
ncbi:DUF3899 domain-containing protein [Virgibacillus necropolis]|uniref:DUF3899 domain-containing protein n=1 Tax=Virgibacillus necropolis TaxID=163877 RepID=A0A221MGB3_9BACI|nr:DUF3899 domain-containing protein [Virgibacillus necropolis]ASN06681.1 hypothetical protein CFK40_17495 [Virgibacillus necropolis]